MNYWINSLPIYQWIILGLVPPLIFLLYFLKLRRVPLEVPSTYLWTKTVEDMHVNSLWQKLRQNLLLMLQLLAALLLMLSCLRPGCDGEELAGERFIFVVDQSASMSATDTETGITRLEEAKRQVCALIDQMKSSDNAMIISFSDNSIPVQSYTPSKGILKSKVKSIPQTQRSSDINEALLAASGLANPGRTSDRTSEIDVQVAEALPATIYIFSDGAVKEVPKFSLGNLTPEYRPIGSQLAEPPANIGITGFAINDQLEGNGQVQVFARISNSGIEEQTVGLSLFVGDELADARQVTVDGVGALPINFDLSNFLPGLESAEKIRLQIDEKDFYMQDNNAYCVLNPPKQANILVVTDSNEYLEFAMSTGAVSKLANVEFENRDFLKDNTYKERATLGLYDLVIFDQCAPETMPLCNTVFFGQLPPGGQWQVIEKLETAPIIDFSTADPLMYDVNMGNVNILSSLLLKRPQGSSPLIESSKGTIMMVGPREGFEDLVIGFSLVTYADNGDININTDWPKSPSFPFFVQNIVYHLAGATRLNASRNISPGDSVKLKLAIPDDQIAVTSPNGTKTTVKARPDSSFVFGQSDQTGIYQASAKGEAEPEQLFAVNLLDSLESNLQVRDELNLGYEKIEATISSIPARKEFWTWIVLLVLLIITIEWYIYNRRVFI